MNVSNDKKKQETKIDQNSKKMRLLLEVIEQYCPKEENSPRHRSHATVQSSKKSDESSDLPAEYLASPLSKQVSEIYSMLYWALAHAIRIRYVLLQHCSGHFSCTVLCADDVYT